MDKIGDRVFLFLAAKAGKKIAKKFVKSCEGEIFSAVTLESLDPQTVADRLDLPLSGFVEAKESESESESESEGESESESESESEKEKEKKKKQKSTSSKKTKPQSIEKKQKSTSSKKEKSQSTEKKEKSPSKRNANTENRTSLEATAACQNIASSPPSPAISPEPPLQTKRPGVPFKRVRAEEVVFLKEELKYNDFSAKKNSQGSYGERAYNDLKDTRGRDFRQEKNKKKKGAYKGGKIDTNSVCSVKFDSDSE